MKRQSQQGIALVITLILLSVITFMAVTFLVVSRHESESVDTTTQQTIAKFAADGILQQAEGQIVANMLGQRNGYNFGLLVSTNYVSPGGYDPSASGTPPTRTLLNNVNYSYIPSFNGGVPINVQADQQQMLNNLLYLPRAPVFVSTNKNQPDPEFRFYHDLNGNGIYDTNGFVIEKDLNNNLITNFYTGDPEWIGFLERPDQRHSPSNFFLSRGAFIAIPIGNTLDINFIHNQAKFIDNPGLFNNPYEGYLRNQGVGAWEINLAAFLHFANTNVWDNSSYNSEIPYSYASDSSSTTPASKGTSFDDAASILQYRYSTSYRRLSTFQSMFPPTAQVTPGFLFGNYYIDGYAAGPLMTGPGPLSRLTPQPIDSWSGADNPVRFNRPRDLLTAVPSLSLVNPAGDSFTNRLYQAGMMFNTNGAPPYSMTNSYGRYTLYRILSQIGFNSAPEPAPYPIGGGNQPGILRTIPAAALLPTMTNAVVSRNQMSFGTVPEPYPYVHGRKMNLNYNNLALDSTNFISWTPLGFFTNAADRLLRSYNPTNIAMLLNGATPIVTNINLNFIPVYPVNYYTPSVHRLLQLAANMYDATTNKNVGSGGFDYPSVFRPSFAVARTGTNIVVYINGYTEAVPNGTTLPPSCLNTPLDLRRTADFNQFISDSTPTNLIDNLYGVPYVIGVRSNLPNFNQFSSAPVVQITRTLMLGRTNGALYTNVSYTIGVSNVVGLQCWNAYTNLITRPAGGIRILAVDDFAMQVTNTLNGTPLFTNAIFGLQAQYTQPVPTPINPWPNGLNANGSINVSSFAVPMLTNAVCVAPGMALTQTGNYITNQAVFFPLAPTPFTRSYYPDWSINVTNRVRAIIQDVQTGRILDYVELGTLGQLTGPDSQDSVISNLMQLNYPSTQINLWDTNAVGTNNPLPIGINNQYRISTGNLQVAASLWSSSPGGSSPASIQLAISRFNSFLLNSNAPGPQQMPFTVATTYKKVYDWSANDPLVHYMAGDLTDLTKTGTNNTPVILLTAKDLQSILTNLSSYSSRYQPWNTTNSSSVNLSSIVKTNQLQYRDPMVRRASDWQFLTNKYPNIGWLGRIHRGTPWQTVYLKSSSVDMTINPSTHVSTWQAWTGNPDPVDAANSQPTADWALLDLFTATPNDNAGRGQLSINQTNMAAWAALLDGVLVLSNSPTGPVIDTTTNGGGGQSIISAIYSARTNLVGQGQVFTSTGQLLTVPQLTVASPYINTNGAPYNDPNLTDAVYERIPQQIASLLRVGTPRYEIYAYGQALKPADRSIIQSGQFFGMPTNYQITGEVLTKTVVRFDNMPIPGQPLPGTFVTNAIPVQGLSPLTFALVTNVVPPIRAAVEAFTILGPDQ